MASDTDIAHALIHDANVILTGDGPGDHDRERTLEGVKKKLRLAEKLLAGKGDEEAREAARTAMHPQTTSLFGITS